MPPPPSVVQSASPAVPSASPALPGAPRRCGAWLLDAVLPPRCLACGAIIASAHALCERCWPQVRFIAEPLCACCGLPFEIEMQPGGLCGVCAGSQRVFERMRAAIAYDDGSRRFILAFKNGDRTDAVRTFAPWMVGAGRPLLDEADLLVPVPLHWTRLFLRRYNQAALLAHAIGRIAGKPVIPNLLLRRRRTHKLGHLGKRQRADTVRGAFGMQPRMRRRIEGRRVLLIDDVYTTGSTTDACARTLLRAGAGAVDVLTLARVVRPGASAGQPASSRQIDVA